MGIDSAISALYSPKYKHPVIAYKAAMKEGLAGVETESGEHGYIDMNGQFVIRPQYADAKPFLERLAAVRS